MTGRWRRHLAQVALTIVAGLLMGACAAMAVQSWPKIRDTARCQLLHAQRGKAPDGRDIILLTYSCPAPTRD